jgi:hypothetical protein
LFRGGREVWAGRHARQQRQDLYRQAQAGTYSIRLDNNYRAAVHLRFSGRAVSELTNGKASRMTADLPTTYLYSLFTYE